MLVVPEVAAALHAAPQQAAELTVTNALGGVDAVHLASVLTLGQASPLLAVWGRRLHSAARAAGVRTAPASL